MERRLSVILSSDVVGYSRSMGLDEAGTLATLKSHRCEVIDPKAAQYGGRTIKLMGDGALMEFTSVVDAVAFAVEMQFAIAKSNAELPKSQRLAYRVGINLGDIIVDGADIYGDGVNIAARLQALAEPGGVCITRSVHTQVHGKLDLTYQDLGPQTVKNIAEPVPAYGVLLDAKAAVLTTPVAAAPEARNSSRLLLHAAALVVILVAVAGLFVWQPWAPEFEPVDPAAMAHPLPVKPSIAVLAFDDLSTGEDQGYLSDAIAEGIITKLSHFSELFIIARNSSFFYRGKAADVRDIAAELGARYILEGSRQKAGDRLRVTVQLIDAVEGNHIWAETYDRDLVDIFAVQDEIAQTIVATLEENIDLAENDRLLRQPTESLGAYELVRRGRSEWLKFTPEGNEESKLLAERALELDPNYSEAYIRLFWAHINCFRWGWCETHSREESLGVALEMARKAVELEPFSHRAHWVLANATMQSGDIDQAIAEYDRAIELNPNSASVRADSIEPLVYVGRAEDAVSRMKAAIRLNPYHPDWYLWNLGWAQYSAEQYEGALASLRKMNKMPNGARRTLASVLVRLDRLEEAQAVITELLKNEPDYSIAKFRLNFKGKYKDPADLERWINDLRKAGMP